MDDGEAVDFLAKNGLPRNAAIGVIDVLRAESGLDPTALNPKEGAYGIAQWTEGRKANLYAYAQQQHEPVDSLRLQLKFLLHELETVEKGTLLRLQLTHTVNEAIDVWVTGFEHPENDAEVEKRAEEEGGQALTAPIGEIKLPAVSPATATQASVGKHDYSHKVYATGKQAGIDGSALAHAVTNTAALIHRLPRF
jgi:hypothetical protein